MAPKLSYETKGYLQKHSGRIIVFVTSALIVIALSLGFAHLASAAFPAL